jgi:hypothetical protein
VTITTGVLKHRVAFSTVLFYDYGVLERDTVCSGGNVDLQGISFLSTDLFIAPYAQKLLVQYSDSKFAFKQDPNSVPLTDPILKDWYLFVYNSL